MKIKRTKLNNIVCVCLTICYFIVCLLSEYFFNRIQKNTNDYDRANAIRFFVIFIGMATTSTMIIIPTFFIAKKMYIKIIAIAEFIICSALSLTIGIIYYSLIGNKLYDDIILWAILILTLSMISYGINNFLIRKNEEKKK